MTRRLGVAVWSACVWVVSAAGASGPIDPNNPPQGRFSDDWSEIYMAGGKVGYGHSVYTREGNLVHTTTTMTLRIDRAQQPIEIKVDQKTTELVTGAPVGFESVMDMSVMQTSMRGRIKNGKVTITTSQYGMETKQTYDFADGAVMTWGAFRETLLRGFEPGTKYTTAVYVPDMRLDAPVRATTTIGEWGSFTHRGLSIRGQHVTVVLTTPVGSMEMASWVDASGMPLKAIVPMPGLGDMEIITTDQATAMADFVAPEIFMTTVLRAGRHIDARHARRIKYRVTPKTAAVDLSDLPQTGMQTLRRTGDGALEIVVARQAHKPTARPGQAPRRAMPEYLGSNLMMNTSDPALVKLADEAAGGETEPFALGDKLRRFVSSYVKDKTLSIGFATASEVCRTREGDCSEHGVLLATLGRIKGLPSRVAVGLAYVERFGGQRNIFGYHLWTQFYMDGRWVDFDAALGETECSPTRIALAVSSLQNAGLADLSFPLIAKIGGIKLDVVEVE